MRKLILLMPLIGACVTQGTYDLLKAEHDTTTAKLNKEFANVVID